MEPGPERRWLPAALLAALAYASAGLGFGVLAGAAGSGPLRFVWRLAAFAASGVVFLAHLAYEHLRLHSPPRASSWHAAAAVAVGAFLLAGAANLHPHPIEIEGRLRLSLVLWPLITAVPALVVALLLTHVVGGLRAGQKSP